MTPFFTSLRAGLLLSFAGVHSVSAQDVPPQFLPAFASYQAIASTQCAEMDGGEFDMHGGVLLVADFNADGITDPIVDTHGMHCSTSATLFGGASGGWTYDVFISEGASYKQYSFLAESSMVISDATTPILLLNQHGSNCDVTTGACYQAYFWAEDNFRSASEIQHPVN
jgi:hypothetical protein